MPEIIPTKEANRTPTKIASKEITKGTPTKGEIKFAIHIEGAEEWSWAMIENNGAIANPGINPHNEAQDKR